MPKLKTLPCDAKWLDKQLGERFMPPGTGYGSVNGNALMQLLTIVSGRMYCDPWFRMAVLPRHQRRAKELLLKIIEWYEKTPPREINRCYNKAIEHYNDYFDGLKASVERQKKKGKRHGS